MRKQPLRFGRAAMMLVFATLLIAPARAKAGMVVTDAGLALGLRLSTFASDFPNDGSTGPLGTTRTDAPVAAVDATTGASSFLKSC